jgi:flagellin
VSTSDLSNLADEINNNSGTTGVTATVNGGSLTLRQADGKNIRVEDFTHSVANANINIAGADSQAVALTTGGNDSTVVSGVVSLDSFDAFTAFSNVANTAGSIFNAAANGVLLSQETLVSSVDVTTQAGANNALKVIDAGIATIDKIRAGLGAVQNRFEATIANLQNVSENVSAARSRVQDADFAAETSALTKAQILQQAGVAILAQSNQIQQSVLSLLQ